jgi:uncharacterized protein (TIGR03437 family)
LPNTRRRFFPFFITLAISAAALNAQTLRFQTTLGGIDVILTPSVTPMTVANFMTYVNSGAYSGGYLDVNGEQVPYVNTIIHRSLTIAAAVPPYVIQGGGYALGPANVPSLIPQNPPVNNEFSISNTRGTLAMALYGSNTNSATDQWYFNTSDNSSYLDSQDFTVFGNVANDASLAVMDAINALPTYTYNAGADADFMNLPLQNYSCPNTSACPLIKPANYIFVNSIAPISPASSAAGVQSAATFASIGSTGISPGEIITLYGTELGPTQVTTLTLDPTGSFVTTSLEGTQVLFNGVPGPMIFTYTGQIAVIVPYEIAAQSTVNVVVSYLGVQTSPIQFKVVPANPGLFTLSQTGKGDAAIVRLSDSSVISTTNPASQGDTLELYGEGYGVATPGTSLPDGTVVVSTLPVPAATTVLLIDGQPVPTSYAGGAGDEVNGVMQINFTVPPQLTPGPHTIQVKVGSATSPAGVNLQTQ